MNQLSLHLIIGLFLIIGVFAYWGRIAGWYKKGGLIYEWWHNRKNKKNQDSTDVNNEQK